MKRVMRYKRAGRKAFTLVEILIALAVVGVLFGLIFAFYKSAVDRSKYVEAVATVDSISKAEEINQMNTGDYVAADNTQEVNDKLGLDIESKEYNYMVVGVTNDNFIVLAEKIMDDINNGNLATEPTIIAKNKTGPVSPESLPESTPTGEPGNTSPEAPGGGGPGGGGPGGGSPSGENSPESNPAGAGSPNGGGGDTLLYPHQRPVDASLLDFMTLAPLADDRLNLINDKHIHIVFVDPNDYGVDPVNTGAWWYGIGNGFTFNSSGRPVYVTGNTIFVNQDITSTWTNEALASIISHEATHADYDYNPDVWIAATEAAPPFPTADQIHITTAPGNSIDQEFQADTAMVQLWTVVKDPNNPNDVNNSFLNDYKASYDQGEASFKADLKRIPAYAGLPNF